jgi:arginyl-tRNA--protein-N-Asp/Glu arginylyltransferase
MSGKIQIFFSPLLYVNNNICHVLNFDYPSEQPTSSLIHMVNDLTRRYRATKLTVMNMQTCASRRVATEEWIIIKREKQALQAQYIY